MLHIPFPHSAQPKALVSKSGGAWPQTRFPANGTRPRASCAGLPIPTTVTSSMDKPTSCQGLLPAQAGAAGDQHAKGRHNRESPSIHPTAAL